MLHIALHFAVPLAVAYAFWRGEWRVAFIVMMATMAVDLDHLLADLIYDPDRCSIGFHPLHQPSVIVVYAMLFIGSFIIGDAQRPERWGRRILYARWIGAGLLIHMALDAADCAL